MTFLSWRVPPVLPHPNASFCLRRGGATLEGLPAPATGSRLEGLRRRLPRGLNTPVNQAEGVVAVPIRALNIPDPGSEGQIHLILLVEQDILNNAPGFNAINRAEGDWLNETFEYWRQYVPLQAGPQ